MSEKTNFINLDLETALKQYISCLNDIELVAFDVAKEQLGDSFELNKSIGFIEYLKHNNICILKS